MLVVPTQLLGRGLLADPNLNIVYETLADLEGNVSAISSVMHSVVFITVELLY